MILRLISELVFTPKAGEDNKEQVDDVEVQLHGSQDVLFGAYWVLPALSSHNPLRIEHQELQCTS